MRSFCPHFFLVLTFDKGNPANCPQSLQSLSKSSASAKKYSQALDTETPQISHHAKNEKKTLIINLSVRLFINEERGFFWDILVSECVDSSMRFKLGRSPPTNNEMVSRA